MGDAVRTIVIQSYHSQDVVCDARMAEIVHRDFAFFLSL